MTSTTAAEQSAEPQRHYRGLFQQALEIILVIAADRRILEANASALSALGYSANECLGLKLADLLEPSCRSSTLQIFEQVFAGRSVGAHETTLVARDGDSIHVELNAVPEVVDGRVVACAVSRDVTQRRQQEQRLQQAITVFDNSNDGILITDARASILAVNRAFTEVTGYEESEIVGSNPRVLQSGRQDRDFYAAMWGTISETGCWQGEIWNRRKSGELYPEWLNISAVRDSAGELVNHVGVFSDISSIKASQERLDYLAHHDPLTELPNRLLFLARLEQALERTKRSGTKVGLIYLDLDRFKEVNDTLGHQVGDELLVEVGRRLRSCSRAEDTVARLGGDEFVMVLEGISEREDANRVVEQIGAVLRAPCLLGDVEVSVEASIGISVAPDDGLSKQALIREADADMYREKARRRVP